MFQPSVLSPLPCFAVNKPKVLVVMHHTFNPRMVVAESRRQVEDRNVVLTVDCLFHEGKLLTCDRNDIAWDQICRGLGISNAQVTATNSPMCLHTESVECTHMGILGGGRNNQTVSMVLCCYSQFFSCAFNCLSGTPSNIVSTSDILTLNFYTFLFFIF